MVYDDIMVSYGMNIIMVIFIDNDKEVFKLLELFGLFFVKVR